MYKVVRPVWRLSIQQQRRRQWFKEERAGLLQRAFQTAARLQVVKPFVLADIGEGIKEVQIIQWFVQPGARVEQFDRLCEVASDKATTEITSRFDGVIKQLHYQPEDVAQVGRPLCDIDIQSDVSSEDEALITPTPVQGANSSSAQQPQKAAEEHSMNEKTQAQEEESKATSRAPSESPRLGTSKHAANLATPAVRGLLKELKVRIEEIPGTGKDGQVLKEDVHKFIAARDSQPQSTGQNARPQMDDERQKEVTITLTPIQSVMFKTMTKSLSIPHFLYADEVDLSKLSSLRTRINSLPSASRKLSHLSFIIKAVSLALYDFPLLNARIELSEGSSPKLVMREKHNIGIAMDTPQGLLVPNIKNVAALSILEIAEQLAYLQVQSKASKLSSSELTGGTITVSNIGSIGGTYVAPVLVQNEVAILGIGKSKTVPAFDEHDNIIKKTVAYLSWSADHRVVDGATMARMGERMRGFLEEPALMVTSLR